MTTIGCVHRAGGRVRRLRRTYPPARLLRLGGFDESYRRPSIEDIEFGSRACRGGYAVRLRKSLQAKHLMRWTVRSLVLADVRDRALPWGALLLREGLVDDLNLRWSSRLAAVAAQLERALDEHRVDHLLLGPALAWSDDGSLDYDRLQRGLLPAVAELAVAELAARGRLTQVYESTPRELVRVYRVERSPLPRSN